MNLSQMRSLLAAKGIRLSRAMGQSFLHEGDQLDRIVALADLGVEDCVLEIGPGLGPLTERLLAVVRQGRLLALEKDRELAALLLERLAGKAQLEVEEADALEVLQKERRPWKGWKVVSNLPYSVASPILVELAEAREPPDQLVVTLQKEVAERVMAKPNCRDYGVLTLLVQLRYEPQRWFKISRQAFFPVPAVDSGCVRLELRPAPLLQEAAEVKVFKRLVRRGFSQRRKMVPKLWRQDWPAERLEEAMNEAAVDPQWRAEHVSLEQYVTMARRLAAKG